ncbi:bifunctional ADP-dependent NAD(P)H-hydrate dehydratase/NAD(P)H-hydrate epimerase [Brevibacterium sp. GP-SGM9]|uniref:bifunctional ADP-dependent NAD(P)H-hydrate dehydratase/NAD(P)H-hydrate epimerase n=1 Tax=Brevibacterium sp. GP-SGM9 TaxID=3376990 RepID=UPI0039A48C65
MTVFAYPSAIIRDAEGPLLEQGIPLMARAARALANVCLEQLRDRRGLIAGARVCVLAGPGNNAGDALFAAAALRRRGVRVTVITLFDRTHVDGLAAARRAGAEVIDHTADTPSASAEILRELARADLVLDGILGTGGRRGLPDDLAELIREWREAETESASQPGADTGSEAETGAQTRAESRPLVISVDTPSDLDPEPEGADRRIHADHTVTFGGLKAELIDPRVAEFTGSIHVIDIGLDLDPDLAAAELLDVADLRAEYPRPEQDGYKYSRGVAGVLAGSEDYPGAGVLTTTSAVNCGVGMVRYLGSELVAEPIIGIHAEVVNASGRVDSIVMGPGDPESEYVQAAVDALAETTIPVVLDAGALDMIARVESMQGTWLAGRPVLLTPHAGELARLLSRLLGEIITSTRITADPVGWAREAARVTGMIVLLKGHRTVIAAPDGYCVLPAPGPASLATAGSGDVLAGILGGLAAVIGAQGRQSADEQVLSARDWAHIAGLGVLIHNSAGRRAINAGQLADAVAEVVAELIHGGDRRDRPGPADGILDR